MIHSVPSHLRIGLFGIGLEAYWSQFPGLEARLTAYIEEVADACKRLKKGKLNAEDLKKRLQKIAHSITGGEKTDALAKKKPEAAPAPESTIIVTEKGPEGAIPEAPVTSPELKLEPPKLEAKVSKGKKKS